MKRRWAHSTAEIADHPYEFALAILGIVAAAFAFFGFEIKTNQELGLILGSISAIAFLLLLVSEALKKMAGVTVKIEHLHDRMRWHSLGEVIDASELKDSYEGVRDGADLILATWTALYNNSEPYFKKEGKALGANHQLRIRRMINPKTAVDDSSVYSAHLSESSEWRKTKRYIVRQTELVDYDVFIAGVEEKEQNWSYKAILVFNSGNESDNTPVIGILFDPKRHSDSSRVVESLLHWFNRSWKAAEKLEESA